MVCKKKIFRNIALGIYILGYLKISYQISNVVTKRNFFIFI